MASAYLRPRLRADLEELQENPYPNIQLQVNDQDLTNACLILTPQGYPVLHLTIIFPEDYPLRPPRVQIDTSIRHPNIFGNYICASILNTHEGYTPAYTLKGICIQLLSFFGSDSMEQVTGGPAVNLATYKRSASSAGSFRCLTCGFDNNKRAPTSAATVPATIATKTRLESQLTVPDATGKCALDRVPPEVFLNVIGSLDFEGLIRLGQASPRARALIADFDVIRSRELQCFVLKENFGVSKLGVGVSIAQNGRQGTLESEFDLVSAKAFSELHVRESVHGIPFTHWLPLPLSQGHWRRVQGSVEAHLGAIARTANLRPDSVGTLFKFMNDIVVRLNLDVEQRAESWESGADKSTLRHASEKAIESYFHLFHLLVCFATGPSGRGIVAEANRMIRSFAQGQTDKTHVPNLGHLLTALLISDTDVTEPLMKAIITEAITRNVVWLLDRKGAGMAELGYLEDDEVSHYRLGKTFQGSRTSYRLLMFSELFRRTALSSLRRPGCEAAAAQPTAAAGATGAARPSYSTVAAAPAAPVPPTKLEQLRSGLFRRHGAPPAGAAAHLAAEVRRIQQIDDFPSFLREMGIAKIPSAAQFTSILRDTVRASVEKGYSELPPPSELVSLRVSRDGGMDRETTMARIWQGGREWRYDEKDAIRVAERVGRGSITFFPKKKRAGRGGARGWERQ